MKKILFYPICFIILFSGSLSAAPVFEIDQPRAVYKNVIEGKPLIHTFQFKNSGDEKLEIKNMKAKG